MLVVPTTRFCNGAVYLGHYVSLVFGKSSAVAGDQRMDRVLGDGRHLHRGGGLDLLLFLFLEQPDVARRPVVRATINISTWAKTPP